MKNLRLLRESHDLSQQKLADRLPKELGPTQQKIHAYETGSHEPDIEMLKALANFFGTSIDYLVGNTDVQQKPAQTKEYALDEEEQALVDTWRGLLPNQRRSLSLFIDTLRPD